MMNNRRTLLRAGTFALSVLAWLTGLSAPVRVVYAAEKEAPKAVAIGDKVAVSPAVQRSFGKQATVVVFLGTGCPVSNAYLPHLNDLARKYEPRGVRFLGVNANAQDSAADVARHAREFAIAFPVIKDDGQRLADALGAQRVPETVILDAQQKLRYRGRIDDRHGVTSRKEKPTREDLAVALDELLAGKAVSMPQTAVSGCLIGRDDRPAAQPITYSNQVARIIQSKCQGCHRADGAAPFALSSYQQTRAWAKTIKEVVVERRMPPWHADPHFGKFANDRSLSQEQIDTLVAWIDGGAARGDDKDLPKPIEFPRGRWTIGEPDVVFTMPREFTVPAKGVLSYQDFIVETHFAEDRWVERAQILPGSKAVHHAGVFVEGGSEAWLCVYVPGDSPLVLPPGMAKRIPAGAKLRFNLHYTPTGKEERDRTSVGLIFAKQPPQQPIQHSLLPKQDIRIPAGEANHREEKTFPVSQNMKVLSFFPHMHLRGKSWEYRIIYPDGRTETVLKVPRYDFNWQHTYRFAEPLLVPAGSKIQCIAHYDNSKDNPSNPDPQKTVTWGPQSWDEMMVGSVEYLADVRTAPDGKPLTALGVDRLPAPLTFQAARLLATKAAQLRELPLATDVAPEVAFGLRVGQRATLIIPDKRLALERVQNAGKDVVPIGQLWLKDWPLMIDGKPPAAEKLRTVPLTVGNQQHQMVLCLLGVRKNAEGVLQLLVYAKDKEPVLILPLRAAENKQQQPLELATERGTEGADTLVFKLLDRYQAVAKGSVP